jgi:hypothetical protein
MYPLRAYDAMHLASAKALQERVQGPLFFACWDSIFHRVDHDVVAIAELPPLERFEQASVTMVRHQPIENRGASIRNHTFREG